MAISHKEIKTITPTKKVIRVRRLVKKQPDKPVVVVGVAQKKSDLTSSKSLPSPLVCTHKMTEAAPKMAPHLLPLSRAAEVVKASLKEATAKPSATPTSSKQGGVSGAGREMPVSQSHAPSTLPKTASPVLPVGKMGTDGVSRDPVRVSHDPTPLVAGASMGVALAAKKRPLASHGDEGVAQKKRLLSSESSSLRVEDKGGVPPPRSPAGERAEERRGRVEEEMVEGPAVKPLFFTDTLGEHVKELYPDTTPSTELDDFHSSSSDIEETDQEEFEIHPETPDFDMYEEAGYHPFLSFGKTKKQRLPSQSPVAMDIKTPPPISPKPEALQEAEEKGGQGAGAGLKCDADSSTGNTASGKGLDCRQLLTQKKSEALSTAVAVAVASKRGSGKRRRRKGAGQARGVKSVVRNSPTMSKTTPHKMEARGGAVLHDHTPGQVSRKRGVDNVGRGYGGYGSPPTSRQASNAPSQPWGPPPQDRNRDVRPQHSDFPNREHLSSFQNREHHSDWAQLSTREGNVDMGVQGEFQRPLHEGSRPQHPGFPNRGGHGPIWAPSTREGNMDVGVHREFPRPPDEGSHLQHSQFLNREQPSNWSNRGDISMGMQGEFPRPLDESRAPPFRYQDHTHSSEYESMHQRYPSGVSSFDDSMPHRRGNSDPFDVSPHAYHPAHTTYSEFPQPAPGGGARFVPQQRPLHPGDHPSPGFTHRY